MNKQTKPLIAAILHQLSCAFPKFVHSCVIVNAPMFFENFFNTEMVPLLEDSSKLVYITGEGSPKELTDTIEPAYLPKIYGGKCDCKA